MNLNIWTFLSILSCSGLKLNILAGILTLPGKTLKSMFSCTNALQYVVVGRTVLYTCHLRYAQVWEDIIDTSSCRVYQHPISKKWATGKSSTHISQSCHQKRPVPNTLYFNRIVQPMIPSRKPTYLDFLWLGNQRLKSTSLFQ